ncbi:MAG: outer membrane protein transport protein [Opitutales bacterium]|jgi:long-chain fatty acid transport protein
MEIQRIKRLLTIASGLTLASAASGAGFAIIEQSASGIGNAFAGGAAVAEDASTIFFNPAGMILLKQPEVQTGVHMIAPQAKFTNKGSTTSGVYPTQGPNADGGETAFVPNFYYAHPINDRLVVGFGIHAPFGLATEYDKDWVGRYQAVRSEIKTVNFNPSVAYRINDKFTIGAGVSVEYVSAHLTNAIDLNRDGTPLLDGFNDLKGDDIAYGWNLGLLYEASPATRFGAHYRSSVKAHLEGDADFTLPELPAPMAMYAVVFADQKIGADLTLPDSLSVSFFHQLNDKWSVMGDVTWMNWSTFYKLDIDFETALTEQYAGTAIIENWRDNWRYSLGTDYKMSDTVTLRGGLAYDQTPVKSSEFRSPRIPDASRVWLSLGLSWDVSQNMTLDAGYVHIFVDDPNVDNSTHTAYQHVIGTIDACVNIFSVSMAYRF